MRIAQVSPLFEAVPPKLYGGTERVVYYLTEELVREGHDVTLFASADSVTSATLVSTVDKALRLDSNCEDQLAPHIAQLYDVTSRVDEFDIIHFHTGYLHFPFSQTCSTPNITTLHGKLSVPELQYIYRRFHQPVVSISNQQREALPYANFVGTIYHGLPADLHPIGKGSGNYLAFLGRISPEKGIDKAIEWAKAAGITLKIAAKVDKADKHYFEKEIKHLLDDPLIEFIGEINEAEKSDFLGNAMALLFPINWDEPFGMVMIEAMACGTPVIAHGRGSVREVIEYGKNGFIVSSTEEAVNCIKQLSPLQRKLVRQVFEERFTANKMAKAYLQLYEKLCSQRKLRVEHKAIDHVAVTKLNQLRQANENG
ncbi:MAG: glycosyltransferase family 4 protein [Flavisolibacter sp.]